MSDVVVLECKQELGVDGWQDEDGVEHYDSRVLTPYGELGNLKIARDENGAATIEDAPGVILISEKLISEGGDDIATVWTSPLGAFRTVSVVGVNGSVRYQLVEKRVEWSDRPEDPVPHRLAFLTVKDLVDA